MEYQFINATTSVCPECMHRVPAKIVRVKNEIRIWGTCKEHGKFDTMLEEDADFYLRRNEFLKSPTGCARQMPIKYGCPYDCGLCPDHEQHTCTGLIEITDSCNMCCPLCFASSATGPHKSIEQIEKMMDFFIESEGGEAEILQISGGEPTIHPQIKEILLLAKSKKIKYVMLNTNGIRCAEDDEFVAFLQTLNPGFELYLQFDGFDEKTSKILRGRDYREMKQIAIKKLSDAKIPITFVSTIARGVNDHEIAHITKFAMDTPSVRGVNFQPMAYFGRIPKKLSDNRISMTGIIKELEIQSNKEIMISDFIPLPCNVDRVAFTFFYKQKGVFAPITRNVDPAKYVPILKNTMAFHHKDFTLKNILSCCGNESSSLLNKLAPLVPMNFGMLDVIGQKKFLDENTFRITVVAFIDRYCFDITAIKRECVHFITPELKKVPFSTFNMMYRDGEVDELRKHHSS